MRKYLYSKMNSSVIRIFVFISIFLVTPFAWGDFLISIGDYFHIVYPTKQMSLWMYSWDHQALFGGANPNNVCAIFPFLSFLSFLEYLKVSAQLSERIWIISVFCFQFFSIYYLFDSLNLKSKNVKFVSSILYVINPVNLIFLLTPPISIGIALVPLTLGLLINGIQKKSAGYFLIIIIISFVNSYTAVNPSVFFAIWFPFVFYVVLNFFRIKKSHLFLLILGLLLTNIYWIFNVIIIAENVKFDNRTSWASWTSSLSSFLNMFRFQGFWAWDKKSFGSMLVLSKSFYDSPLLIFISFCLTSSAFFIFLNNKGLSKSQKSNLYIFTLLFLVSFFIAKGMHEPFSFLNLFAYNYIPFFSMFRTPWTKFMPIAVFSLIVLFCYSGEFIEKKVLSRGNKQGKDGLGVFTMMLLVLILVFCGPFFICQMFPADRGNFPGGRVKIPDYWYEAAAAINNNQADIGRILLLPENYFYQVHYFWPKDGYYGVDPANHLIFKPLISGSIGGFVANNSTGFTSVLYKEISSATGSTFINFLRMANVEYILFRDDLDWTHVGTRENFKDWQPLKVESKVKNFGFNLEENFGMTKSEKHVNNTYFKSMFFKKYPCREGGSVLRLYKVNNNDYLPKIYGLSPDSSGMH